MSTAAIILAAGASRRLGRPKQLVEIAGEPLVHKIARVALEACDRVAVIEGAVSLREPLADVPVEVVRNSGWEEGIASSIRAGIRWASDADAVVLLTCDQHELAPSHLHALLAHRFAASRYDGALGIPAVFPRGSFPALLELEGDRGAKPLLACATPVDWPGGLHDLDVPRDLDAFVRR
jgi:CTP:molybdopterin cytidylyltransferase MocA